MLFPRSPNAEGLFWGQRGRAGSLLDFSPSAYFSNMMATEVSSEDAGSVTTETRVASGGGGGPETAPFPCYPKPNRVRVADLGQEPTQTTRQHSNTSPDSLPDTSIYPVPGGDITGSVLSPAGSGGQAVFQGANSGTRGGMCNSPTSESPTSRSSPTSTGPDGSTSFPPLPPAPPMDESDLPDWGDEEDLVFPLSAPPTNQ